MGGNSSRDKAFEASLLPKIKSLTSAAASSAIGDDESRVQAGRVKLEDAVVVLEAGKKNSYQAAASILKDAGTNFKLAHAFRYAAEAYMCAADIAMQSKQSEQEAEMYEEVRPSCAPRLRLPPAKVSSPL